MSVLKDEDGFVIVTVKDLVTYLQKLDQTMRVELEHDGWMDNEIDFKDIQDLIKQRGIFHVYNFSTPFLVINN